MTTNSNTPFGFVYLGTAYGATPVTGTQAERIIANTYTTPICKGDYCVQNTAGYLTIANTGNGSNGAASAGVFDGCYYLSASQGKVVYSNYWSGGDAYGNVTATIIPTNGVPPQLFKVQSLLGNFTIANLGQTVDINVGTQRIAAGYGVSGMTVDVNSINGANSGGNPFIVVGLYSSLAPSTANGTNDTANYNIVIVRSNPFNKSGV